MISAIGNTTSLATSSSLSDITDTGTTGGFNAALEAAKKEEARKQALQSDFESIREKGFSAWARDTQIEALKEKLRKKIMAEMGVDEDSLSSLSAVMQEVLRKKIEEEVDRRLEEELAKTDSDNTAKNGQAQTGQAQTASVTQTSQAGKNDRDGKDVPVIPALSWPGGASLF